MSALTVRELQALRARLEEMLRDVDGRIAARELDDKPSVRRRQSIAVGIYANVPVGERPAGTNAAGHVWPRRKR